MEMRRFNSANSSTDQAENMRGNASNVDRRAKQDRRKIELPYSGQNRRQYSWYDRRIFPWNDRRQNNLTGT